MAASCQCASSSRNEATSWLSHEASLRSVDDAAAASCTSAAF